LTSILVVDDDPQKLSLLSKAAKTVPAEVWEANSFEEALVVLREKELDLVVADLDLSCTNRNEGLNLLDVAKQRDETTQVIIVTNYSTPETSRAAMAMGAFDFMDRNPSGVDFFPLLRAKMKLAVRFRELLRLEAREALSQPVENAG